MFHARCDVQVVMHWTEIKSDHTFKGFLHLASTLTV